MRSLIVDDDFVNRQILQRFLSRHGDCDVAVDGREAFAAYQFAHSSGEPYDLLCLDIMMPNVDGQETLEMVRRHEAEHGLGGDNGVKIIMTTALSDPQNVMQAFKGQCDAYVVKPIEFQKLTAEMSKLGLID